MRHTRSPALWFALLAAAGAAHAIDYPPRKAGLWEMRIADTAAKSPPTVMQQCIDAATDKLMRDKGQGLSNDMCSKNELRADGPRLVGDSVCKLGATTVSSQSVMTGDFGSGYRMEIKSRYSPPMMGKSDSDSLIEAKWVGPCTAGQKPGDMILPNGMKMNVLDMPGASPKRK